MATSSRGFIDFGSFVRGVDDAYNAAWKEELRDQQRVQNIVAREEYAELQDRKREEHEWKRLTELGKQAERDWQKTVRGFDLAGKERDEANAIYELGLVQNQREAEQYLSNLATNRELSMRNGMSPVEFITRQRDAVLADPRFLQMTERTQGYVLNKLTELATVQMSQAATAGDWRAVDQLADAFGLQGRTDLQRAAAGGNTEALVNAYNRTMGTDYSMDPETGAITMFGEPIDEQMAAYILAQGGGPAAPMAAQIASDRIQGERTQAVLDGAQMGGGGGGPVSFIPDPANPQFALNESMVTGSPEGTPQTASAVGKAQAPDWIAQMTKALVDGQRDAPMHDWRGVQDNVANQQAVVRGLIKDMTQAQKALELEGGSAQQAERNKAALVELSRMNLALSKAEKELVQPIVASPSGSIQQRVAHFLINPEAVYRDALSDLEGARATLAAIKAARDANSLHTLLARVQPKGRQGMGLQSISLDQFKVMVDKIEKSLEATLAEAMQ